MSDFDVAFALPAPHALLAVASPVVIAMGPRSSRPRRRRGPPGRIQPVERMAILDVLRGFALFGVLLVNMVGGFSGLWLLPRAEVTAMTHGIDGIALIR